MTVTEDRPSTQEISEIVGGSDALVSAGAGD